MNESDKIYEINISTYAYKKLDKHFNFLSNIDENAAKKLYNDLIKVIESLITFPNRNPFFNQQYIPINKYRYMVFKKRYRIIYYVENDIVYIENIQDCRQDNDF